MHKRFLYGFTLVELLISIVVIAILTGVVAMSYGATRAKANDTAVQQDLNKFADALNVYFSSNVKYPVDQTALLGLTSVEFATTNYKTSANAVLYCVDTTASSSGGAMAVIAKSLSGRSFYVKDESSVAQFSGTFPSGNTTTDCQAANSAITTVTAVWVHDASRADAAGVSSGGWLVSVL